MASPYIEITGTDHGTDWVSISATCHKFSTGSGTYYVIFYCGAYNEHQSSTFTISGAGTYDLYWRFDGLKSGENYPCYVDWYGSTGNEITKTGTVYVPTDIPVPSRWYWYSTIGGKIATTKVDSTHYRCSPLTAREWNDFCTRINEVRQYKGFSSYNFSTVSSGYAMLAMYANQTVDAISVMGPSTPTPGYLSSGDRMTASWVNQIASSLNSLL